MGMISFMAMWPSQGDRRGVQHRLNLRRVMTRPLRSDPGSYLARPVENLAVRQGLRTILFLIEHSGDAPFSLDPRQSHPSGTSDSLDW